MEVGGDSSPVAVGGDSSLAAVGGDSSLVAVGGDSSLVPVSGDSSPLLSSGGGRGLLASCTAQAGHCSGFSCGARAVGPSGFSNCCLYQIFNKNVIFHGMRRGHEQPPCLFQ